MWRSYPGAGTGQAGGGLLKVIAYGNISIAGKVYVNAVVALLKHFMCGPAEGQGALHQGEHRIIWKKY